MCIVISWALRKVNPARNRDERSRAETVLQPLPGGTVGRKPGLLTPEIGSDRAVCWGRNSRSTRPKIRASRESRSGQGDNGGRLGERTTCSESVRLTWQQV